MTAEAEQGVSTPNEEVNTPREDDAKTTISDNDTAEERPVRRKLKETRITSDSHAIAAEGNSSDEGNADRGRLAKKRSRDDMQADEDDDAEQSSGNGHRRKRSRDSKDEDKEADGDARKSTPEPTHNDESSHILSPKKKRSLDQLVKDSESVPNEDEENVEQNDMSRTEGEREKKRHRDASEERRDAAAASTKPSLPKSFLNTSAVSPFASLGAQTDGEEAKKKVTSPSSFAASGLASFAKSEQSPFGSLGSSASTPSVFKAADSSSSEKPAASGFAAAAGASPFASTAASGFASLGSGFGSGFGGGFGSGSAGKLNSFASASGPGFGSTTSKPFGAAADSDAEEDEEDDDNHVASFEKEKEDERFYAQQIETGEEEEKTYFSSKAKLFHFTNKEWKERGVGTFKINVKEEANSENDKVSARMIMRADGVLRVMLNSPIFKGMPVGDVNGEEPKSTQLNLASIENGITRPLLLRLGRPESAKELYRVICDLQKQL